MEAVVLVIHMLIALALIGVVMIQKSEGGGLGLGGGGTMGGMMTTRGTANLLTRMTAILAGCFMLTSVVLVVMANNQGSSSLLDRMPTAVPAQPAPAGTAPATKPAAPAAPAAPATPAPPVAH